MRFARKLAPVLLCLLSLAACRKDTADTQNRAQTFTHDLSIDEARGGHTLSRHVGRTDDQLRDRLGVEHDISAASTYTDRESAERAVGSALHDNVDRIQKWYQRGPQRPNLVLDYNEPNDVIGRVMNRGAMGSVPCDHAIVVLKAAGESDYVVLTSYPECRP